MFDGFLSLGVERRKQGRSRNSKELADVPVGAIAGISESDVEHLKLAFNVKTIRDLANLKYLKWVQAIVTLAETEQDNSDEISGGRSDGIA